MTTSSPQSGSPIVALALIAVVLCGSCGDPQGAADTERAVGSQQPEVRALVIQVAGMMKSKGGST